MSPEMIDNKVDETAGDSLNAENNPNKLTLENILDTFSDDNIETADTFDETDEFDLDLPNVPGFFKKIRNKNVPDHKDNSKKSFNAENVNGEANRRKEELQSKLIELEYEISSLEKEHKDTEQKDKAGGVERKKELQARLEELESEINQIEQEHDSEEIHEEIENALPAEEKETNDENESKKSSAKNKIKSVLKKNKTDKEKTSKQQKDKLLNGTKISAKDMLIPGLEVIKWVCVILCIIFIGSLLKSDKMSSTSFNDMVTAINGAATLDNMNQADDQMIKRLYGISPDDYDGVLLYYPSTNMGAEEILVVKLKNLDQKDQVLDAVEERISTQKNNFNGYGTNQTQLLNDSIVEAKNGYVIFVCGEDNSAVKKAFNAAL